MIEHLYSVAGYNVVVLCYDQPNYLSDLLECIHLTIVK